MIIEVILATLALVLLYKWLVKPRGLPPGPRGYPVFGSGILLDIDKAKEYQNKYGDIFRTEMFGMNLVYLCSFKLVKEAMGKTDFVDRPNFKGFHFLTEGKEAGVILSNGQRWTNARRFLLRNLRDLGMGKSSLDDAIIVEAKHLVEDFKRFADKPTTFPESLNIAVLNVVWQMVASCRYDLYDKEISEFMRIMKAIQNDSVGFITLEFCPILKKIVPKFLLDKLFGLEMLNVIITSAKELFGKVLQKRKEEMDPSNAVNVIDEYLVQMDLKTDIAQYFDESDLLRVVFDLFNAGFDTTANMIRWMILYAAKYPEVQRRIQKQIDEVIPKGEFPANHHKAQLPLVEAFIHEVLRCSSMVPFAVMHATSRDTYFADYFIPKGSLVFPITGLCHYDSKIWDKPQEFSLERFLDSEGRFVSHKEGFAPFGIGKRSCLGESLARMELSIFTACLLQNFTFSPPEGKTVDLTPDDLPMARMCRKQEFVMSVRK